MRKCLWLWALAAIWTASSISSHSSASAEDNPRYREVTYYYVAGVTKGGPVRSESYRDQGQAARVMANWQREHAAGGLLEADPFVEGPEIRTETHREWISPPAPDRPAAPPPSEPQRPGDRPGETSGGTVSPTPDTASSTSGGPDLWTGLKEKQWVDVPDRITGNPNGPPPKTDKDQQFIGTFIGTEGGNSAVTFQFLANGDVIAKDKDGEWKGKWVSFGDNQIQIELLTPNAIEYEAKLENGKLTGWGRSRKSGKSWSLNLSDASKSLPPAKNVDPVAGKKGIGTLNIRSFYVDFNQGGTLSAYTSRNSTESPFQGRYTITGDRIEFVLGPSRFVGTVQGNRITGTRQRSDGIDDSWELTLR